MNEDIKEHVTRRSIWLRLVFMIVLGVAFSVAGFVAYVVIVFQFLVSLFTGQPNEQLSHFGRNLARYFQQIIVFLTFTTEEKPFPFAPWPNEPQEENPVEVQSNPVKDTPKEPPEVIEAVTDTKLARKPKKRSSGGVPKTRKPRTSPKKDS
jgi:hypothetical protein